MGLEHELLDTEEKFSEKFPNSKYSVEVIEDISDLHIHGYVVDDKGTRVSEQIFEVTGYGRAISPTEGIDEYVAAGHNGKDKLVSPIYKPSEAINIFRDRDETILPAYRG